MRANETGAALVTIYANGRLESAAYHEHDGGEAYMVPLIRQAIRYAKTHYDDGDILQILLSEGEMQCFPADNLNALVRGANVRHVYTIAYRWNAEAGTKAYSVQVQHLERSERLTDIPVLVHPETWKDAIHLTSKRA